MQMIPNAPYRLAMKTATHPDAFTESSTVKRCIGQGKALARTSQLFIASLQFTQLQEFDESCSLN